MTRLLRWHYVVLPILTVAFVTGCGGSSAEFDDRRDLPPADQTVRYNSGFEGLFADTDGVFSVGVPPVTARFSGGTLTEGKLARSGNWAWVIGEGGAGDIQFRSPVSELTLWFGHETEPEAIIAPVRSARAGCEGQNVGLDNTESFGVPIFARGGFNDWGNSEPPIEDAQFFNAGDGVYNAQFEIAEAATYEFKIADGGWTVEYGAPGDDIVLDVPVPMSGGPALGGPNSSVEIPEPGCYNWQMTITDSGGLPAPGADLLVTFVEIDDGDALLAQSLVKVYDTDDNEIAVFEGIDDFQQVEVIRAAGEKKIKRVEVLSLLGEEDTIGIGRLIVDDFRMGTVPDTRPRELSLYYSRPSGDYSATRIEVTIGQTTTRHACVPAAGNQFGCVVVFGANGGDFVSYTVFNGDVADPAGAITFDVNDASDNAIYSFEGSNVPILRSLPAVPTNANEVILFYFRPDGQYNGFGLHLFPDDSPAWTDFTGGEYPFAGIDPQLGAYFIIALPGSDRLTAPYSASPAPLTQFPARLGLIIHNGDEKDPGPDQFITIAEDGNVVFVTSGVVNVSSTPPIPGAVNIVGMSAHWVTPGTLLWDAGSNVAAVELHHAANGGITTAGTGLVGQDVIFDLTSGTNPLPDAAGNNAHLGGLAAWTLPEAASGSAADLVKGQLIAVGFDENGDRVAATAVQIPLVLDALYANAARQATLGVSFTSGEPTLRLWAPTANSVAVNLYDDPASDAVTETVAMTFNAVNGTWEAQGTSAWNRRHYTYAINVYAPSTGEVVDNVVTDPYSVSLSTGSTQGRLTKSQIVDLNDPALMPDGWTVLQKPALAAPEDIALYELHVRDFSVLDTTVPEADRGKYTAFAGNGAGVAHLSALADAGLTHVHVLPAFDIATVNEDAAQQVNLSSPVEALCSANPAAASLCVDYPGMTLLDVMASQSGNAGVQQQIADWMRDLDGFNWGYDPFHYNVPEGSYASDAQGPARIAEFRAMVKGLSDIGLRTVMDVVYNHTNAAGNVSDRSVLDRVVPGYYHRMSEFTGIVQQDSCCPDTASEHAMMEKLVVDSIVQWARQYKVDGFRFDIMGFHSLSTMVKVRDALRALTVKDHGVDGSAIYLYGEGWNFGDVQNDRRFVQATQANMAGSGIGTFNDRLRDAVRGGGPFDSGLGHVNNQGFFTGQFYDPNAQNSGDDFERAGLLNAADLIRLAMAGTLKQYEFEDNTGTLVRGDQVNYAGQLAGYTEDPQEIINYAASHDGETLWDISVYKHPAETSTADRVRAHNVAQSIVLLGQGIPFLHAGQDMLRSKSMDRNSFDSGDWFNRLDFSYTDNNFAVGEPRNSENAGSLTQIREVLTNAQADATSADIQTAVAITRELLALRKASRLFRLRTAAQVSSRVRYHNTGPEQVPGLIVQSISDGEKCTGADLDVNYSRLVVAVNASVTDQTFALFTDEALDLHPILAASADPVVRTAAHSTAGFFIPARTTAVFVQPEPAVDCGALGVDVFLRGSMNDWAAPADAQFDLRSGDQADVSVDLQSILYFFKVADNSFDIVDCGASVSGAAVTLNQPFAMGCGTTSQNLQLDLRNAEAGTYVFSLDASDAASPAITVSPLNLDLTAPDVTITTPAAAAVLAGNVAIRATVTDEFDVVVTRFYVDGLLLGTDVTPEGDEYSVIWNTSAFSDGQHVLTAQADDDSGNVGIAAAVTVTVDSTLLNDDSAPLVTLDAVPANLTGTVALTAQASDPQGGLEDPTGVSEVRFYFSPDDGSQGATLIDADSTEPYSVMWDTTTVANGGYQITAEAVDGAGNLAMSDAQPASVSNAGTYDTDIFLCGILDDCGNLPGSDAALQFLGNDLFGATLNLTGNTVHAFRIVDSNGIDIGLVLNCGSESLYTPIVLDQSFALTCAAGSNDVRLDLSREGVAADYRFVLDASVPIEPLLMVSAAAAPPVGAPGDVTAPTVSITGTMPAGQLLRGVAIGGDQVVLATASDNASPIARVEFFVDGALLWSDTTAPYEAPWDTASVADGDHELTARAVDAAGNAGNSDPLAVTVDNIGPYGVDLYPRGSWDPNFDLLPDQLPMTYLGSGLYESTLTLPAGSLRFKVASDDFDLSESNCNPPVDNTPAILNKPLQFVCGQLAANAKFDVSLEPDATDYTFFFDASRSLLEPRATVRRAEPGPEPVPGDTTSPTFTSLLSLDPPDDPVTFDVVIDASVSDNNTVASVTFLVDNVEIWADFTAPFQAPWDSTLVENGTRAITALAMDANGNVGSSAPLTVTVDNPDFGPFGLPMFVRGAFVDDPDFQFGTTHTLVLLGNGVYEAVVNIDRTAEAPTEFFIGFKVADAGWTDGTNCGASASTFVVPGQQTELVCSSLDNNGDGSVNVTLNLLGQPQPADYRFTIDASDFPATRPKVTVTVQ